MPPSVVVRVAAALVAVALLVFIDLRTKSWAASELRARGPRTVAGGQLRLQYSENTGLAFGRLRNVAPPAGIIVYSAVMALGLAVVLLRRLLRHPAPGFLLPAGCVGLLAGTLGNLHDRLERGYVIDFIDFERVKWATFNIADAAITAGLGLCLAGLAGAALRQRGAPAAV